MPFQAVFVYSCYQFNLRPHRKLTCIGFAPSTSVAPFASRAQRKPIQFLLLLGSIPVVYIPCFFGSLTGSCLSSSNALKYIGS